MEIDTETVSTRPSSRSFDWDTLIRLHAKGLISDPVSKAKSVVLTDEGLRASERLFGTLSLNARYGCSGSGFPRRLPPALQKAIAKRDKLMTSTT